MINNRDKPVDSITKLGILLNVLFKLGLLSTVDIGGPMAMVHYITRRYVA